MTDSNFHIRPLRPDDMPQWRVLWDGYNAFYERAGPTALPEAVTQRTWQRLLDPTEAMWCWVAEAGDASGPTGRLLGLAHALQHRSTTTADDVCYLQDLFTEPHARGQGVGEALIRAVHAHALGLCLSRLYWHTREGNTTARRLYDRVASAQSVAYTMPMAPPAP